jgi:hypothetical protein
LLSDCLFFATELVKASGKVNSRRDSVGMGQIFGQSAGVISHFEALIWITEIPKGAGRRSLTKDPGIRGRVKKSQGTMFLYIVKRNAPFRILSTPGKFPKEKQRHS